MERLRIGDVASRSGVTRDAIRFYERSGLLAKPGRTQSHQRIYDVSTLDRIRLVRQLQNCGLTIGDIKEIIFLRDADRPVASTRLVEILRERLGFLEEQIAGLESCRARLVDVLRDVAGARSGGYDTSFVALEYKGQGPSDSAHEAEDAAILAALHLHSISRGPRFSESGDSARNGDAEQSRWRLAQPGLRAPWRPR